MTSLGGITSLGGALLDFGLAGSVGVVLVTKQTRLLTAPVLLLLCAMPVSQGKRPFQRRSGQRGDGASGVGSGFLLFAALRKFARHYRARFDDGVFVAPPRSATFAAPGVLLTGVALLGLRAGLWLATHIETQRLKNFGAVALLIALYVLAVNTAPALKLSGD